MHSLIRPNFASATMRLFAVGRTSTSAQMVSTLTRTGGRLSSEEVWRRGLKTTTSASASTVSRIARVDEGATESAAETDVPNTGTCTGAPAIASKRPKGLLTIYSELSKSKLTLLVASTAAAGYVMGAGAMGVPLSVCEAGSVVVGTSLASAAANTLNQCYEISTDSQMRRTMMRPLPTSRITLGHALGFAGVTAASGFGLLYTFASPMSACMALGNLALYAGVYTPLKQKTTWNTWVGAVVGAVPPMLGWMAVPEASFADPGMWALGALLFSWQMPHFMALSWLGRKDYKGAGYQMLASFDAKKSATVSLRHALYLVGICGVMPLTGMVDWPFAVEAAVLNAGLVYSSYKFYSQQTVRTARRMFRWSLLYLPVVMAFLALHRHKKEEDNPPADVPGRPKRECDL